MKVRERLARQPPGYQFTIGRILAIYSGLMVALLLAALDQTIVATALPKVVSDLGGITQYTWVFTAYMLGSTVTVPLYGKLGRRPRSQAPQDVTVGDEASARPGTRATAR
jgi:MFS family permease